MDSFESLVHHDDNVVTGWENVSDLEESTTAKTPESPADRTARQERKLIGVIYHKDANYFNPHDYTPSDDEIRRVHHYIRRGDLTTKDWHTIIGCIEPTHHYTSPEALHARIMQDPLEAHVLSAVAHVRSDHLNDLTPAHVTKAVKLLPTPLSYEVASNIFLRTIKSVAPEPTVKAYEIAADHLAHHLYGKQQQYWETAKALQSHAKVIK